MSQVERIVKRIENLSPEELARLRDWFMEFDAQAWDRQIDADSKAGRLDRLVGKSVAEHNAGKSRTL